MCTLTSHHPNAPPKGVDSEDYRVDFNNAGLYLGALQTVFSACVCACVSVLSCWLVPAGGVSAVRTLALCTFFGVALMRNPLRIGRAHGVTVVFESLQLAIPIYLSTQVIEQLIHTCASSNDASAPSGRRVIFHVAQLVLIGSGFLRARRPMDDTDVDFILTVATLLVIAMLPPPAIAFAGPLCQSVGVWEAFERLVRAFAFAVLYSVNVYSLTSSNGIYVSETQVVVTRSASASIWVLGSHVVWLPLAIVQSALVIYARVHYTNKSDSRSPEPVVGASDYTAIDTTASTDDDEGGEATIEVSKPLPLPPPVLSDPVAEQARMLAEPQLYTPIEVDILNAPFNAPLVAPLALALKAVPPPVPTPVPPHVTVIPVRSQKPAEDNSQRGPKSFQLVSGPTSTDTLPLDTALHTEAYWQDRAAEIAERMRTTNENDGT